MKLKYKHVVAFSLMLLMLLSTVGFSIISTFCHGCDIEHTLVKILATENTSDCNCCITTTKEISCCSVAHNSEEKECEHEHNTHTNVARLDYEATEAKTNTTSHEIQPLVFLFSYSNAFIVPQGVTKYYNIIKSNPPPLQGRTILALKCVLRN